jgi:hypothetical protein
MEEDPLPRMGRARWLELDVEAPRSFRCRGDQPTQPFFEFALMAGPGTASHDEGRLARSRKARCRDTGTGGQRRAACADRRHVSPRRDVQGDVLDLEVLVDADAATFATKPGVLHAAERRACVGHETPVQADHP